MIAFKFLRADGTGVFTGFRWPLPQAGPGAWVQSGVDPCRSGIHACRRADLPLWAGRTLYEIELAGEIVEDAMKVVAPRGRLRPDCAIGSALFERIHLPYHHEGQRTGAFRFGDSRAMALAGALQLVLNAVTGFTNKSLRAHVAGLLGHNYTQSQMSYDLRRLHLHGLIERLPRSNTYVLTPDGIRVAVFYTKLQNRLLRPLLDADKPPARIDIRRALKTLEAAVNDYIANARLAPAI